MDSTSKGNQHKTPTAMEKPAGSEHSPLPWQRDPNGYIVRDANGLGYVRCYGLTDREARANAGLVHKAVNHHDELVAACRSALEMCAEGGDQSRTIALLEAAIAKAEGR